MSWFRRLRLGIRSLRKRPVFTATTIVCLALGIGASTAIFSVVNALLLRETPVRDIERVAFFMAMRNGVEPYGVSPIEIQAYTDRTRSFQKLGLAVTGGNVNLTGGDRAERVRSARISRTYLDTLGVEPVLGRNFSEREDLKGGPSAVLMSHGLWRRRFGAEPSVVGSTVRLDSRPYTVAGVLPRGFDLPAKNDVWFPLRFDLERMPIADRASHSYMMVGRLRAEATLATATSDLVRIAGALERETPSTNEGWSVSLIPFRSLLLGDVQGRIRSMLEVLAAAVGFLLVIACVNAGHLFLARFVERERQIAVSAALGAGRLEITRQLLTESLLVALSAGLLGSVVALAIVPAVMSSSALHEEAYTNLFREIPIDGRVLAFSLAVSGATALVFGSIPLARLFRSDLGRSLRASSGAEARRFGGGWLWVLVSGQIAMSLALLVGAGLLVQSFRHLNAMELGFRPAGLVSIDFTLPETEFPGQADRLRFSRSVLERVADIRGVTNAGMTTDVPLRWGTWDMSYEIEGEPPDQLSEVAMTAHRVVTPGYLETIGVTLLRGRTFTAADRMDAPRVAVVSEEFARRAWPGAEALGKRVRIDASGEEEPWMTVVGVVSDVKEDRYNFRIARPVWYLPLEQVSGEDPTALSLVMRIEGDARPIASEVRQAVGELYAELAPGEVTDLGAHVRGVTATEKLGSFVASALATLGTALASIGLYGALAYTVRQRFREFGIRLALGAGPRELRHLVLGRAAGALASGLVLGLAASLALGRFLSGLLFDVSPYDPSTLGVVALILALVTLAACYLPARRAAHADPVAVLRTD